MKPPAAPIRSVPVTPAEYARLRQLPGCLVYHSGAPLGPTAPKPLAAFYRRPAAGELYVVVDHAGQLAIRCFSTRHRDGLSSADLDHALALAHEMTQTP